MRGISLFASAVKSAVALIMARGKETRPGGRWGVVIRYPKSRETYGVGVFPGLRPVKSAAGKFVFHEIRVDPSPSVVIVYPAGWMLEGSTANPAGTTSQTRAFGASASGTPSWVFLIASFVARRSTARDCPTVSGICNQNALLTVFPTTTVGVVARWFHNCSCVPPAPLCIVPRSAFNANGAISPPSVIETPAFTYWKASAHHHAGPARRPSATKSPYA
ncbi:MAG: hypothetical protein E6K18_00335 [Methanobacteriota archaeon]|nr:MAG: hypothetical protein E6K18_00335 [Euryarchaeota archaeon]